MKIIIIALLMFIYSAVFARDIYVKPYIKKDGTYVQEHYKTAPDNNIHNNYSTKGNINPYTGKEGTVDPYKQQKQPQKKDQNQQSKNCYQNTDGKMVCY